MAAPAPKTSEILTSLTVYINSGQRMPEWELAKARREIMNIDDPVAKLMLTALHHGAAQKEEDAIDAFETAIGRYSNTAIGSNYCAYLQHIGRFEKYSEVSFRLADSFEDPEFARVAYTVARIKVDLERVHRYASKFRKYYPTERGEVVMEDASKFIKVITDLSKGSGIELKYLNGLSEQCVKIADQYRKFILGTKIASTDGQVAIIMAISDTDADVLADMNFELAMAVAKDDALIDLPLTAWYRNEQQSAEGIQ